LPQAIPHFLHQGRRYSARGACPIQETDGGKPAFDTLLKNSLCKQVQQGTDAVKQLCADVSASAASVCTTAHNTRESIHACAAVLNEQQASASTILARLAVAANSTLQVAQNVEAAFLDVSAIRQALSSALSDGDTMDIEDQASQLFLEVESTAAACASVSLAASKCAAECRAALQLVKKTNLHN
jgi:hypothetical protein